MIGTKLFGNVAKYVPQQKLSTKLTGSACKATRCTSRTKTFKALSDWSPEGLFLSVEDPFRAKEGEDDNRIMPID